MYDLYLTDKHLGIRRIVGCRLWAASGCGCVGSCREEEKSFGCEGLIGVYVCGWGLRSGV